MTRSVAVAPSTRPEMFDVLCKSVQDAGANLSTVEEAEGLIWADPSKADLFPEISESARHIQFISRSKSTFLQKVADESTGRGILHQYYSSSRTMPG